jgi:aldose 1-epimerase
MVGEEDTLLCPTNHAYFNLDGSPDILSHRLQIDALKYAVKGETGMPEGEQAEVADTPLDFRKLRPVGDALKPEYAPFYKSDVSQMDDIFLLSHNSGELDLVARLEGKESGRYMDVYTDMPALIVFTGFVKEPVVGKDEQVYSGYKSIALETQYVPNAVNCTGFDIPVFPAGTPLDSETIYAFGVIDD